MKIEVVKINKNDRKKCEEFAHAQVETSIDHYRRRKQGNRDKIVEDIVTGKLGEIATYRLLRRNGIYCQQPDFEIYNTRGKSFDADISWKGFRFHCKSQSADSAYKYGRSWILQWGGRGKGHTDKLFKNRDRYDNLVPCGVYDTHVHVYGIIRVPLLFDLDLIKEPKVRWFADTKRAIYFDDLRNLIWKDRWGFLSGK